MILEQRFYYHECYSEQRYPRTTLQDNSIVPAMVDVNFRLSFMLPMREDVKTKFCEGGY